MNKDEEDNGDKKVTKDTFKISSDVSEAMVVLMMTSVSSVQDKGVSGILSGSLNLMASATASSVD